MPTRLLDWTENPLTALHFALMNAPASVTPTGRLKYVQAAAVWVLDPTAWNQSALTHVSYKGGPLTPGDEALNGYAPRSSAVPMNSHPVALYGAHNSAQIVAQQGVFMIFGADKTPMEQLVTDGNFPSTELSSIVVPPARIKPMRKALLDLGITKSTVFPDLEGLAKETKRHFEFET